MSLFLKGVRGEGVVVKYGNEKWPASYLKCGNKFKTRNRFVKDLLNANGNGRRTNQQQTQETGREQQTRDRSSQLPKSGGRTTTLLYLSSRIVIIRTTDYCTG